MSEYLIQSETLTSIADAIRSKTGESGEIKLTDFSTKIQNITSGGSGVGKLGGTLVVVKNDETYYPNQSICINTTYPMKASYTQEYLSALYTEFSVNGTFPLNEIATVALLLANDDDIFLYVVCFVIGGNNYYGLLRESNEPKFWVPIEVATVFGMNTEGWYIPLDELGMNFAASDIPDYLVSGKEMFIYNQDTFSALFDPSEFIGFSSIKVIC